MGYFSLLACANILFTCCFITRTTINQRPVRLEHKVRILHSSTTRSGTSEHRDGGSKAGGGTHRQHVSKCSGRGGCKRRKEEPQKRSKKGFGDFQAAPFPSHTHCCSRPPPRRHGGSPSTCTGAAGAQVNYWTFQTTMLQLTRSNYSRRTNQHRRSCHKSI